MKHGATYRFLAAGAALAFGLSFGACQASAPPAPTPQQPGPVMPTPQQPGPVMPTPQQPGPVMPTPQQPGPVMPTPQQLGPVMPTPQQPGPVAPTPPPAAPTPPPATPIHATPTHSTQACTGTTTQVQWFIQMATEMSWPVYCAILPTGWSLSSRNGDINAGGYLAANYSGPGGATFSLNEGVFCTTPASCGATGASIGAAEFGDRTGALYSNSPGYRVLAGYSSSVNFSALCLGLNQSTCASYSAALVKPPSVTVS